MAEFQESSLDLSTILLVHPQPKLPSPSPFETVSDPEPYTRTVATPSTEMCDSDPSLGASWANPIDVDTTYPGSSQNPMLRGGRAVTRSSARARDHPNGGSRPLSHSHPEPMSFLRRPAKRECRAGQITTDMHDTHANKDTTIDVTTRGHRITRSAKRHGRASIPMEIDDDGMLAPLSNHLISTARTSSLTHLAPSFAGCRPTVSKSGSSPAACSTNLDDDVNESTATAGLNATTDTSLRRTQVKPFNAYPIPSVAPSPRAATGEKPEEDPFEDFTSGSEKEDKDDINFESRSISPSVRSESPSPVPTPPESEYEEIPWRKPLSRLRAQAITEKQPGRPKAQATPIQKKRRTSRSVEWPIVAQARRRSTTIAESPVTAAADDYDDSAPSPRMSTSSPKQPTVQKAAHTQHAPGGRASKRPWTQMLASEAHADREVQMWEAKEQEKDRGMSVQQRPVRRNHGDDEVRNGDGWTLVVENDGHGRQIAKWMDGMRSRLSN
ncbi:MAG: hypothetical protein L6R36_004425 [Xanthoria steineri]|nr:MAG: hypothetical protein L6R36_004425 [Xanthoria steineri]